jgi:Ca2+-binding EF-hand superfamily protein
MAKLSDPQKSELRRKFEKLDPRRQGGLKRPTVNTALRQLETEEIKQIFRMNDLDSQRWQTFTDVEYYMRNIASLRDRGFNAPIT